METSGLCRKFAPMILKQIIRLEVTEIMPNKKFWKSQNAKSNSKIGEMTIYGDIGDPSWFDETSIGPKQFKQDLDALGTIDILNIYINSPGGDVFAGQTIYSILKREQCVVNVYIDGLAASAASIIAMVGRADGNVLHMPKNAMLMIHNAWTICIGYASDMRETADMLDKVRDTIVPIYTEASGLSEADVIELMDAETWMTAQDALDYGFITEIDEPKKVAASIKDFDLSRFKNVPESLRNNQRQQEPPITKNDLKTVIKEVMDELKPTPPEADPKPEESPPQPSGVFDLQKHIAKINQLAERRKNHERKA
jgi:ATP-dependent Clp protease protease subunit